MKTLKEYRAEKGLTQLDLSVKTGGKVKPGAIGDWESNRVLMSEKAAEALAPVLGTTPEELRINHTLGMVKKSLAKKNFKDSITYLLEVAEKEETPAEIRLAVVKGLRSAINALPDNNRDAFGRKRTDTAPERDGLGRARPANNQPAERDGTGRVVRDGR